MKKVGTTSFTVGLKNPTKELQSKVSTSLPKTFSGVDTKSMITKGLLNPAQPKLFGRSTAVPTNFGKLLPYSVVMQNEESGEFKESLSHWIW